MATGSLQCSPWRTIPPSATGKRGDRIGPERAARTLDFSQPIGLTLLGIMGRIPDSDDPWGIVGRPLDALPAGSYMALSDGTNTNPTLNDAIETYNAIETCNANSRGRRLRRRPQAGLNRP